MGMKRQCVSRITVGALLARGGSGRERGNLTLTLAALALLLSALPAAGQTGVTSDPVVSGLRITSSPASGGAYRAGETITAEVTFDQTLAVTGTPRLAIAVGAATRQASGSHTAGESRISFSYTAATDDKDTDGISIAAGALTLNGATIRNAKGEDARLGLGAHAVAAQPGHKVSAPPRVTGVRLLTTNLRCCWGVRPAGWEDPRQTDENLYPPSLVLAEVTFDQPVAVSGTPQVALTIGANTRQATWNAFLSRLVHPTANAHGAEDIDVMAFYYELQASDFDGDGIGAAADALALNGGTIRDAEGEDAALGLGSHAIANQASLRVADTAPSFAAAEDRRYLLNLRANDRLPAATGDGALTYALTGPGAATTLSLPRGLSWNAAARTISGTPAGAAAAAPYTLTATDVDGDTGTLTFALSVVTDPVVSGVSVTSSPAAGDAYAAGETITVDVTFDQPVTVTGAPELALTIGSKLRQATGSPAANRRTVSFSYPVATGDRDTDGISITGSALTIAGATIRNAKGENARLGLGGHAVAGAAGHKVSTPPRVAQVNLHTTDMKCCWSRHDPGWADPRQTERNRFAPAVVWAAVTFDQALVFAGTGRPSLALTIGGATRQAAFDRYLSRQTARMLGKSNSQVLAFFYTLQPSDFDGDGIGVAAGALTLPAGTTLRDAQGEAAVLGLGTHAIANDPNYRVADTSPSFGSAAVQPQHWVAGAVSSLTLPAAAGDGAVSHALTPAQRPSWLKFDAATRVLSGTPPAAAAAAARTGYTWTATDVDGDSTALTFTLTVAAANAPKVAEVKLLSSPAAHAMYAPGSAIEVGVKFDKSVSVRGTPTLALDVGGAARQANYTALRNGYLVFSYTVRQADYDTDGVSIGAGALAAPARGGIFDKANAAVAALGLGSHTIANASGHKVGSPPRVTGVSIHSTPPQAGTYTRGATVTVQVDFDQTVTVTGTPQLALTIGGATRQASAMAESGAGVSRSRVRFSYTVAAADADPDGLGVAAAALTLNRGAIRDLDGQDAVPGLGSHARTAFANAKVDGSRTGLWPDFGSAASPALSLIAGTTATHALPTAAGGDTPLRYTVSPGLPAGLSVNASTAVLSGAPRTESPQTDYTLTATDANGDAATLAFTLKVLGSRPVVSGVSIASTPLAGDTYGASEVILVDVTFERTGTGAMTVRGAPRLAIAVGAAARQASFLSVSGATLRFRYTAQAEDRDTDGIAVAADALALNGGLIRDAASNNAILGLGRHALAAAPAHKVDGSAGRAPAVAGVRMISAPASGNTYTLGETIEVAVRFDQAVGVSGMPNLALTLGSATARAAWNRTGASPTTQIFRHVVQAADRDADGLSIGASALALGGGTIRNLRGRDAALGLGSHALGNQRAHKVDGSKNPAPLVTGVSLRSFQRDGWYDHGEVVEARVTFNKAVAVTGSPQLAIAIGATTRQASLHAASGARVDFRYTVQDGDHDTDGLSIGAGALALNGGTIRNNGVDAALGLGSHALGSQAAHKVDGRMAKVTGVTIETTPAGSAGYGAGEEIRVRVDFDLALGNYQGSRLALTIGDDTRQATFAYARRSIGMPLGNLNRLHYTYTVRATDRDADGLSIAANALSGTIRRRDGNPARTDLGSHARGAQAAHKVTGAVVTPRVTSISINGPLNGVTFGLGEKIMVTLQFNAPVAASRGAHLALTVGNATHRLNARGVGPRVYKSNYGFQYVVQASDRDADGIGIAADGLTLPQGGTLRSAVGVDAALGLPAAPVRKVDGSHNPPAKGIQVLRGQARHDTFLAGESFDVVVFWTKPVTITGTPTLAMQVGSVTRRLRLVRGGGTEAFFRYTVRHDDRDPDGVSIAADALRLEGASITGPGGKAAQLRLTKSIVNDASFKVGSAARPTPTFGAAVVPARDWTVGVPVNFTLPPATDGSGTLRYALLGPSVTPGQYRTAYLWLPPGLRYTAPANHTLSGGTISGTISGHTPTDNDMNGRTWRLTATDADADTATLDFLARIVPDRTPSFGDAAIDDQAWIENAAVTAFDLPEATGGNGDLTYTLAPALPGGVSRAGRRVSGAPGAAMARTQYTWTATDADGDQAALTFYVTVAADSAPSFGEAAISDLSWLQGSPITEVTLPEATGGNAPLTYGIATPGSTRVGTQGLPQGIELDGRVLKGTPTEVQESSDVDYAWLVVDADGDTAELTFDIEVYADLLPSFGDAALADRTWTQRQAITAFTLPAATGGDGDLTYALTPDLPAGVVRDAATREVSGTPTAALAATTYTWAATDADGDTVELTFTAAVDGIPTFGDAAIADVTWTKGKAIDAFTLPEAAGGDGRLTYTLAPDPPAGVVRDTTTREVSGTPTGGLARSGFRWRVRDEDGDEAVLEFHVTIVIPPAVTLALSASTIDESGTANTATVTAALDKASSADTTVTVAAAAGANAAAGDFTLSTAKTLTIAAGATTSTGTVTIAAVDNAKDEHDKSVIVSGSAANDDLVTGPANLTLTITDDDAAPTVSIAAASVTEGPAGSTATLAIPVSLSAASGKQVTVPYEEGTGGTATAGTDYTALSPGSLTIAAGETSGTVDVSVTGDGDAEPDETVKVVLTGSVNAALGTATGTGTIVDDDPSATSALVLTPSTIDESGAGNEARVTATLSQAVNGATTVTVSATAGTNAEAGDFTLSTAKTLTIAAGATTSTGAVTITAEDNGDAELDKSVTVSGTVDNGNVSAPDAVTLTIADDDRPPTPTLFIDAPKVAEGGPDDPMKSNSLTWTVTLTPASDREVRVSVALDQEAGTATAGTDHGYLPRPQLAFSPGETGKKISVSVHGDSTVEPDETVVVALSDPVNAELGDTSGTGTILDDDAPTVTLAVADSAIAENGGTTTVTATLSGASSAATTVTVTTVAGSYTVGSDATITIAAGKTANAADSVTITAVDDEVDNVGDRSVTVAGTASNTKGVGTVTGASLTLTDDEATPEAALVLSAETIDEHDGTDPGVSAVTAALSHASSKAVTLTVAAAPGTNTVAGDFSLSSTKTLTIAAGETESTSRVTIGSGATAGAVTVTAVDDTTDAPDKEVTVTAAVGGDSGIAAPPSVTLTIEDDEVAPGVTLAVADSSVAEDGGTTTVTATLSHASSAATTVTVTAVEGSYTVGEDATIEIAAGETASAADTATITAVNDDVDNVGNRTATVSGTAQNSQGAGTVIGAALTLTDDEATPTATLALSAETIDEHDGTNPGKATVTASLSRASSEAVTLTVAAAAGTNAAAGDFSLSDATTLTVAAGATSSTGTVTVTAVDNTTDAPDKEVTVTAAVSGDSGIAAPASVTLTIEDDEAAPGVTLAVADSSVAEDGGTTTVTATLSHASSAATTVTVTAVDGAYTVGPDATIEIASGETANAADTVTITAVNDDVDNVGDRSVTVSGTAQNGQGVGTVTGAALTLTDDEATPTATLALSAETIDEHDGSVAGSATVTASLDRASSEAVTLTVAAAAGTNAAAGDFSLSDATTLTVAAGATSSTGTVTVTAVDDTTDAPDKEVTVSAAVSGGSGIAAPASVTLTIEDDEAAPGVTLAVADSSIAEDGGTTTVTATLSHASSAATTVTVTAVDGSYTVGEDATIEIAAGETANAADTVTIAAVNDDVDNVGDRSVTVSGTAQNSQGAGSVTGAALTLTDDEATPTATLALSAETIDEHDGSVAGSATVTASLDRASSEAVTLTVAAAAGTNAAAGDFSLSSAKTLSIAAGATSSTGTVTVTAVDDTADAPDKEVTVTAAVSGDSGIAAPASVTLTIEDDEAAPGVTLAVADSAIAENGGTTTVTATLSHASSAAATITVTAVTGAYTVGEDATITIAAGATANAADTVTIAAVNDDVDNVGNRSVTVSGTAQNSQGVGTVTGASLTLTDDEGAPTATLTLSAETIDEHDGTNPGKATVTATLNRASSEAVTLTVAAAAGTNAVAGDFSLSSTKTLSIAAGATSSTGTVTVTAVDDTTDAPDKEVTVSAAVGGDSGIAAPASVTLTIEDDEAAPEVTLAVTDSSIAEDGGTTTVTATLSHASSAATTVTVTAVDGSYTVSDDATIEIAAGETANVTDSVTITAVNDAIDNVGSRAVTVSGTAQNSQGVGTVTGASLTLTDDEATPTVTLALSAETIDEHDGTNPGKATVTATLNRASSEAVTLTVAAAAGTNAAAGDFSLSSTKTLSIAAGATTSTGTVTVTAVDNTTDAPDKEVTVTAAVSGDSGIAAPAAQTLTIEDDEAAPGVTLALADSAINENGGTTTVTATLSHASSAATTITVQPVTGAYTVGTAATIEIAAGETANASDSVTITAENDAINNVGGQPVTVGGAAQNSHGVGTVTGASLTFKGRLVLNRETGEAAPGVTLAVADSAINENGGTTTVTATLSHASSAATTITVQPVSGAYTVGTDATIEIAAGETANTADTATITAVNDDVDNVGDRSVTVSGTAQNSQGVGTVTGASLTLTDDEATPTVTLALSAETIDEHDGTNPGKATVTASLDRASSEAVTLTVTAAAGTNAAAGDFSLSSAKTLSIAAGATSSTGTVTVTAVDNTVDAPDKEVTVTATVSGNSGIAAPASVTLTIEDDEAAPGVTLALADSAINENGGTTTVTATLSHASSAATTITVQPVTGAYTVGTAATIEIAAGETANASDSVTITAENDAINNVGGQPVTVGGAAQNSHGVGTVTGASLTFKGRLVLNRETGEAAPGVTLAVADSAIAENGGTTTVTATLSHASSAATTITVQPVSGAYTVGTDATIEIAAGETANTADTATITAVNDDVDNVGDRSVTVSGTAQNSQGVGTVTGASLTLTDDEATPTVTLALSPETVDEHDGANPGKATVTATLNRASSEAVTLTVAAAAGTNAAAGDFSLSSAKTLSIAAGATTSTGTVTVTAVDDPTDAPDKEVTVTAAVSGDSGVAAPASKTLTIEDDEAAPGVTLAVTDSSVAENGGTTTVTATLSHASSAATTITVQPVSGAYTVGSDATITIAAGATANTADTATITAVNDDVDNVGNRTATVSGTAQNSQGVGTVTGASLTLTDDEATPTATLVLSPETIDENNGTNPGKTTVTASLNRASSEAVTLTVAAAAGTNAVAGDFNLSSAKTLSIAAGATSSTGTVTVTAVDDTTDAPDKEVTVTAAVSGDSGVAAPASKTLTIEDDEAAPGVTLAVADSSIAENGGSTTVTATLSHPSSAATTITVQPVSGAYTVGSDATITIAAGATANAADTATITAVNDAIDNVGNRTATVSGTAQNSQGVGMVTGASLTLTDDEGAPTATLALSPETIDEHDGTNPGKATVTATLNRASSEAVTLTVAVAAGKNAAAGDFTLSSTKTLSIAAGATTSTGTVTVTAVDNTADAPDKEVTVTAAVTGDSGVAAPASVTLTIEDDEAAPGVTLAVADSAIAENGGTTTVTATLSHASSATTTITVQPVTGAYTVGSDATITIGAGETSNAADTATITAVNDAVDNVGNRTATVSGTAQNSQGVGTVTGASLTLTDDEGAPTATLVLSPETIDEHDGTNPGKATVTASLNRASSEAVTLTVSAAAGTNAAAGDFTLSSTTTLSIAAGATSSTGTVTVTAVDDAVDAPDKEVTVTAAVSGDSGIAAPASVTLTIEDDEAAPGVTLAVADSAIAENGGSTTVTATLSHASSAATTITVQPVTGAYTVGSDATITIAAGATANTADTVTITAVNDAIDNVGNRTVTVSGTAQNSQGVGTVTGASLTLTDDEGAPTAMLALSPETIDEHDGTNPGKATVTASLDRASSEAVTLTVSAAAGTNAAAGDFSLSSTKTLSIAAGATTSTGTVTVTAVDDTTDAPDKEVTVTATVSGDSGIAAPAAQTLTIEDDEAAPGVTLAVADSAIVENGGTTTVTATLSHASSAATTITVTAVDGAYTVGTDATIEIAAGETANAADTVTITAVDDAIDNTVNRTVTVSGTAQNSQGVGTVTGASLTLTDDEGAPTATLALSPETIAEHDGTDPGKATLTATLNRASSEAVTLTVSAAAGTNAAAGDFTLSSTTTLSIAAGATSSTGEVTVTAVDDTVDAPDKEVTVSATVSGDSGVAAPASVTLTIEDDEAAPGVTLAVADSAIDEDGGSTTVTATLSHASSETTTITVAAVDGAYTVGEDATIEIAAGETANAADTVTITAVADAESTGDRTVTVTGTAQNGHSVGTVTGAELTLRDGGGDDGGGGVMGFALSGAVEDQEWTQGQAIMQLTLPEATGGDGAVNYALTPELPSGVNRDAAGREVSGTPEATQMETEYTWRATDGGGATADVTFTIEVLADAVRDEPPVPPVASSPPAQGPAPGPPAVAVKVSIGDASIMEGDGRRVDAEFTVKLDQASAVPVTVGFATRDDTATAGADYAQRAGTVTFAPGETQRTIAVPVLPDTTVEANEEFVVALVEQEGAALERAMARGTIGDNDVALLAIDDTQVKEGDRGRSAAWFEVRMLSKTERPVMLRYMTMDGTARAGEDYEAASEVLVFAPGEAAKRVSVTVLGDTQPEADETFGVTLHDAEQRAASAGLAAEGVIEDDDQERMRRALRRAHAEFARVVATDAVAVIGERFAAGGAAETQLTLNGRRLELAGAAAGGAEPAAGAAEWTPASEEAALSQVPLREFLVGSSFDLVGRAPLSEAGAVAAAGGGPEWSVWSRGALSQYGGQSAAPGASWNGGVYGGYLGADIRVAEPLVLGLAVSHNAGAMEYQESVADRGDEFKAKVETSLTSVLPYAHWRPLEGVSLWTLAGAGLGGSGVTWESTRLETSNTLWLGAAGARVAVVSWNGLDLALATDGYYASLSAESEAAKWLTQELAPAGVGRVRLLADARFDWQMAVDSRLGVNLEVGGRWDAGAAAQGFGAELGGGLEYVYTALGLGVRAHGRYLLAHQEREFQDWGASAGLSFDPGAPGRGLALAVAPAWGAPGSRTEGVWSAAPLAAESGGGAARDGAGLRPDRLDAELSYGIEMPGAAGLVTLYGGLTQGQPDSAGYRVGSRLELGGLSMDLALDRQENPGADPAHGLRLEGQLHW